MNEAPTDTVILLGAGATIGSGYTRCGKKLPGDRGFFADQNLANYPALDIMLDIFRQVYGKDLAKISLEEVWTFLEFSSKGVYKEVTNFCQERRKWLEEIRKRSSQFDEHCDCKHFRQDRTLPSRLDGIDMSKLAGWDLRRLLSRIFREIQAPVGSNVYRQLMEKYHIQNNSTTTFVSLNYDVVLEHALERASSSTTSFPWFYAHVPPSVQRDSNGIRILKPHGSLNWLFQGNKPIVNITTHYQLEPVQNQSFGPDDFEEAMIIPPTQLKQAINIEETQSQEMTDLFSRIWQSMADALSSAYHVFIIGYSFPSTDHHFRTLLYQVNHRRKYNKKYCKVFCCTRADGGQEGLVFANANRFFPAESFYPHDRGFEDFVSQKEDK
jgi:hypothetical protein